MASNHGGILLQNMLLTIFYTLFDYILTQDNLTYFLISALGLYFLTS